MERMTEALAAFLGKKRQFLTVTGGGGKTSLLKLLGEHYKKQGYSVLLTTTTKFQAPEVYDWGVEEAVTKLGELIPQKGKSILFGKVFQEGRKWSAPTDEELEIAAERFEVVIAEGDGSRQLPLKYHTEKDPVIPPKSLATIAVLGAWGLDKTTEEAVFGYRGEARVVDSFFLESYLKDPEGLLKGNVSLIVVNGYDELDEEEKEKLLKVDWQSKPVLFGSIRKNLVEEKVNL